MLELADIEYARRVRDLEFTRVLTEGGQHGPFVAEVVGRILTAHEQAAGAEVEPPLSPGQQVLLAASVVFDGIFDEFGVPPDSPAMVTALDVAAYQLVLAGARS